MDVISRINGGNGYTVSVEIEPPLMGTGIESVFKILDPLVELGISYVDITYHPEQIIRYDGDGTPVFQRKRPGTLDVSVAIKEKYEKKCVEPVPHIICSGFTRESTEEILTELSYMGIRNMMALRGDPRKGPDGRFLPFAAESGGHSHANELIEQIASFKGDNCIGATFYPEGHKESESAEKDIYWSKVKVDAGASFLVTQMFFDNAAYWRSVELAKKKYGIKVPIIPGVMPISLLNQLELLPNFFGCSIPKDLRDRIERHRDDREAIRRIGIDWCVEQCLSLRENGAPSLHLFASRNAPAEEVIRAIRL
jgi:methylenetetrahydrofolate reductase (NADPH)